MTNVEPTIDDKVCAYKIFEKWVAKYPWLRVQQQQIIEDIAQGVANYVEPLRDKVRSLEAQAIALEERAEQFL